MLRGSWRFSSCARPPILERSLDLRWPEPHGTALAAKEAEAGSVTSLEAVKDCRRGETEQLTELGGGEESLAHARAVPRR